MKTNTGWYIYIICYYDVEGRLQIDRVYNYLKAAENFCNKHNKYFIRYHMIDFAKE